MKFYKHLSITFFITTIWCVYVFFNYYHDSSFMPGLTLLFDYLFAAVAIILVTAVAISLKFTKVKTSFFYIFAAVGNIFLFTVYGLYLIFSHNVREFFREFDNVNILVYSQFIFGLYFLIDIYRNRATKNH